MNKRDKYREGLNSLYLPLYDELCKVMPDNWQPYSGLRTIKEQSLLWDKGRSLAGDVVTYSKAGESAHNYGCASDWTIWEKGKPIWPDSTSKEWFIYEDACYKVGLKWGGSFGHIDCPHNELKISVRWPKVAIIFTSSGMVAAHQFIEKKRLT